MLFGLLVALATGLGVASANAQQTIRYTHDDAAMNAAVEKAKQTFPLFVEALKSGSATDFQVKVFVSCPGGREHIWLHHVRMSGDRFVGRFARNAECRDDVRKGAGVLFDPKDITDWGFERDGKLHGSFTTRAMLKDMPADRADGFRKIIAPLPD
jgi:uncharacterized protein YegJ (DUF2314 family)